MPRSLDDIEATIARFMFEEWLFRAGLTLDEWRSMHAHGVPEDWARAVAEVTRGRVPVTDWPRIIPSPKALPRHDTNSTVSPMDVNTQHATEDVKRGAARATRKHKALKRLYEKGRTVTSIALELGEGRPRVSAWFAEGDGNRPIPRRHADYLRDKYNIPHAWWARIAE